MEQRKELLHERFELPSRYWEPSPDEEEEDVEELEKQMAEMGPIEDERLPF